MQGTSPAAARANKSESLRVWRNPWFEGMVFHRGMRFTHPYPRHWHDELHLCAYTAGAGYLRCRGAIHLACAGDLILTPPSEVHDNWVPDGQTVSFLSLYIDDRTLDRAICELTGRTNGQPDLSRMFRDDKRLKQQFLRMYFAMEARTSRLEAEELLFELVELLLEPGVDTAVHRYTSPESVRVRRTRDYIAERSTDSISLAELGRIADLSPFHLHRLFSQQTGMPPHAYQTLLRINQAKKLLRSGRALADVAASTGFADQSHFTRHFRRIVGVPPGRYSADFQPKPQERSRHETPSSDNIQLA
jgi:AraC-like DNA-binding protein